MNEEIPAQEAAQRVAKALRKKEEENAHLGNVLQAFGKILIEQARWRAMLPVPNSVEITAAERAGFERGVPLADRARLTRIKDSWPEAVARMMPPLFEGFPAVREDLRRLEAAIVSREFSPELFLDASFGGRENEALEMASTMGTEAELLVFALHQVAKPKVEKSAEGLFSHVKELAWNRGYCPICGSFPEMSMILGKEGRGRLRCGFCSTAWPFYRMSCPFCDAQESGDREIFFIEGREHEMAEACHKCGRYVTGIDLRAQTNEVAPETINISLMHLDVVAQQQGFKPMKGIDWKSSGRPR